MREEPRESITPFDDLPVVTTGRWFGPPGAESFGWLSTAGGATGRSGVLVIPPFGYEWWSSYHTLRVIAERLAGQGHAALRLQYPGTGNAALDQLEAASLAGWESSVRAGVAELRALGCEHVILLGVRIGGFLALTVAEGLAVDAVIAWRPVKRGRRYARELRLAAAVPDGSPGMPDGTRQLGGTVLPRLLLESLATMDLAGLAAAPERVLLLDGASADGLAARLAELGSAVERHDVETTGDALTVPAEDAVVDVRSSMPSALLRGHGAGPR